jgi:hypothetical protein
MSYRSYVGGKIIVTVGGDFNTYSEGDITFNAAKKITFAGEEGGVRFGEPKDAPQIESKDFDIKLSLNKEKDTLVPLGITDFKNNEENRFFKFQYTLEKSEIDIFYFNITDADGKVIYNHDASIKEIEIKRVRKEKLFKPESNPNRPFFNEKPQSDVLVPTDHTKIGTYEIYWDGFDDNGIYDSTRFNGKTLKAKVTGTKNGKQKSAEIEFTTKYHCVDWTDVKIDRNTKRVDVTLRVNLQDGGSEGLNTWHNNRNNGDPRNPIEFSDWDKISLEALNYYKMPPITKRPRTYKDLETITLQGINQFWSRIATNIGKGVKINSDNYEVYVDSKADEKGLSAPSIVYQTNVEESRSRNFELSRKLFFYEGYLYNSNWANFPSSKIFLTKGWEYRTADVQDYKMVSAHEIGHEILLTYGGHIYSKTHKGTSHWSMIIQSNNQNATYIPANPTEIDLMKYYIDYYDVSRTVISEFDLLKVIWLTKISIK